jgi:hypothetical protein
MDVLTIPGAGACMSGSEVVLSVLASETADVDSANFSQEKRHRSIKDERSPESWDA